MRIALIGLGAIGLALAGDLKAYSIAAWDVKFADHDSPASRNAASLRLTPSPSAIDAARDAALVISAVTAANDLAIRWRR